MKVKQNYHHIVLFVLMGLNGPVYSQLYVGFKAGTNITHNKLLEKNFNAQYQCVPGFGWQAGLEFVIAHNKNLSLQTEIIYSKKQRTVKSKFNAHELNKTQLAYLDIPMLFRCDFQGRSLQWYFSAGPEMNIWLSGSGYFTKYDQIEDRDIRMHYDLNFGNGDHAQDVMNISGENQLQLGFVLGTGFYWEDTKANRIGLDFKLSLGQTFLGSKENMEIPAFDLKDNYYTKNKVLSCSFTYLFKTGKAPYRLRKSRK